MKFTWPSRRRAAPWLAASLVATGLAAIGLHLPPPHHVGPSPRGSARAAHESEREAPGQTAFWQWRVAYPTGRFEPHWYAQALAQHERITKGLPLREPAKDLAAGVLDPARATALGPAPLDWGDGYGAVAGRVNAILVHPTKTNIAWAASDGGGVWKTTNCCGPDTLWRVTTDAPQIANIALDALALDPHDPDTLYAGTGDFERNRPFAFGASGVLKSRDGGETWSVLASDVFTPVYAQAPGAFPQRRAISALAVDPNAAQNVVAGTDQGVYFSHDAGASWQGPCFSNGFATQRQDVSSLLLLAHGAGSDVIVALGSALTHSAVRADLGDNGANGIYRAPLPASGCPTTWTLLSRADNGWPAGSANGVPARNGGNPLARLDLAAAPSDTRVLYAQAGGLGVWRSDDAGDSWRETAAQPAAFASGCRHDSYDNGIGFQDYNAGVTVSPNDPDTVFLSSIDLWRSSDGGRHFVDLTCAYDALADGTPGYVHPDNHARAAVGGDGTQLLIGTDGGVYASRDALAPVPTFSAINGGADTIEFYSGDLTAGFDDASVATRAIVGGAQDNGTAVHTFGAGERPARAEWREANGGDGTFAKIEPMRAQRWYYSSQYGYVVASDSGPDGKVDRDIAPAGPDGTVWSGDRAGFLMPFELYKFGDASTCPPDLGCQRMLAGTFRVWESLSGGEPTTSWYVASPDLTKALDPGNDLSIINRVSYAYGDPSIALVATNDGNAWVGFDLGRGSGSATWVDVADGNRVLPNRPLMDLRAVATLPGTVYAALAGFDANTPATPGHVLRLDCDARCAHFAWRDKTGNLPDIPVNTVLANPHRPQQVFAGTDWGLYFTDDIDAQPPTWQRFAAGVPSAMIWDLVIDRGATTLAIFTRSRGAYVWPLPQAATLTANGTLGGTHKPPTHARFRPPHESTAR